MRRIAFSLFLAAAVASLAAPQGAQAAQADMDRSAGAHPVVYDDYPESELILPITDDIILSVTGEARVRFEWVENTADFSDESDDSYSFWPARFNVGFRVDLPRDVAVVTELQGNWTLGSGTEAHAVENQFMRPGVFPATFAGDADRPVDDGRAVGSTGTGFSGALRPVRIISNNLDTSEVALYQAYLETANIGDSIFSMRFGRQELAYGTEFLLGNQDWYDGLSYDAIKGIFEFTDSSRLDIFWAKVIESSTFGDQSEDDVNLYGAYFSHLGLGNSTIGLDAYLIGLDSNMDSVWSLGLDPDDFHVDSSVGSSFGETSALEAYWAGVRFFRERLHGWHWSAELTYLFGDIEADFDADTGDGVASSRGEIDISAWAFEGWLGYTWDVRSNPSINASFTYASGSDFGDYASADSNTFFTPASEVHPRLGLMDLIDPSNVVAYNLGYSGWIGNHSWGVDLWHFEFDEVDPIINDAYLHNAAAALDKRDGRGFDDEIGQEIDLWYNYQYSENMIAQFAVGWFNAGDFIEEVNRCRDGGCDEDLHNATPIDTDDAWRIYANLLVRF